ncbi:unnamed protein product [Linum trigynum]|uniref:Maternal effect embryo arrest 9 n=1 Tax=Linum trigynum TaxID=586398 RepID=A0AAV2EHS1_9ROSI
MENLISQFTLLADEALRDKHFDPSRIDSDLMKLFELEAYKAWAALELEHEQEVDSAESEMEAAEDELESAMEAAMEEFRRFEEEMEGMAKAELEGLERTGEKARRMGKVMEKAASAASKRYVEAAVNSATATMRSAWKGVSKQKVHPA